jgi:hypothetical protein
LIIEIRIVRRLGAVIAACGIVQAAQAQPSRRPGPARAFLYSFILPGTGELACGAKRPASVFLGTELALWGALAGFRTYGGRQAHDYRAYAAAHAAVIPQGKDKTYFADIENYMTIRDYNDAKLRQRNVAGLYPEGGAYDWAWDSDASRSRFERMRVSSDRAYRRSLFVVGGLVLNRLASGIDAARAARRASPAAAGKPDLHVAFAGFPEGGGCVTFITLF